ncbi:hypothetical protein ACGF5M_00575 [Gemmatimonadota bacterium]
MRAPILSATAALLRARSREILLTLGGFLAISVYVVMGEGEPADAVETVAVCLLLGAGLFSLLLTRGVVSEDLSRGVAPLWLQKPRSPVWLYFQRFLSAALGGIVPTLVLAVVTLGLLLLSLPGEIDSYLRALPTALLVAVMLSCITFAFSSFRIGPDAALTLAFLFLVNSMAAMSTVEPDIFGFLGRASRRAAFPVDALAAFTDFVTGRPTVEAGRHLLHLLLYTATWVSVGILGLLHTTRFPTPSGHDG